MGIYRHNDHNIEALVLLPTASVSHDEAAVSRATIVSGKYLDWHELGAPSCEASLLDLCGSVRYSVFFLAF